MNTLFILSLLVTSNPTCAVRPSVATPTVTNRDGVTSVKCESACTVVIPDAAPATTRCARRPYAPVAPAGRPVRQMERDPAQASIAASVPAAPAFITNKTIPGAGYGVHTSTLFPTAQTMEKGHTYYDFQFLGMYSGVQHGFSENLELGVKIVVPFAIAAGIETDLVEPFLKYGVHVSAKYRFYKGENLHLSVRASLPVPTVELIGSLVFGRLDLTAAVGVMAPLETDVAFAWLRSSVRWRISSELHLLGEYAAMNIEDTEGTGVTIKMFALAIRRIKGRFSYDLGVGAMQFNDHEEDWDSSMSTPMLYLNFGYSI